MGVPGKRALPGQPQRLGGVLFLQVPVSYFSNQVYSSQRSRQYLIGNEEPRVVAYLRESSGVQRGDAKGWNGKPQEGDYWPPTFIDI